MLIAEVLMVPSHPVAEQHDDTRLLTVGEAARHLDLSPDGVRHLESTGQLTAQRTERGLRLFRLADVMKLVAKRAADGRGAERRSRRA